MQYNKNTRGGNNLSYLVNLVHF